MERPFPVITVTEKAHRFVRDGHVWVFADEVLSESRETKDGEVVDVVSKGGKWLGAGFICHPSKIRVRIISHNTNDRFDEAFFRRRIRYAIDYRRTVMRDDFSCCRLIFGEADSFPGFTVDRFSDVLVTEVQSVGIEIRRELLYRLLREELSAVGVSVRCIFERSDGPLRGKEGLKPYIGYYPPEFMENEPFTEIVENGIRYKVDYKNGQKTGFFLDQKYNRSAVAKLALGKHVLDCFTHTGSFALNAALGGAESVTALDISGQALEMAKENAKQNGLSEKIEFVCGDVFTYLTDLLANGGSKYDFIILDPPAFTKSNDTIPSAYRGYKEINTKAMRLLPRGGYLATCSCSHFMTRDMFERMLKESAQAAGVTLRRIEERKQGPDHPMLYGVPETDYLKFFLLQIV